MSQNSYLFSIWIWLLCHASYRESKIIDKGSRRILPPGTVVFGIKEIARKWECSPATVHKWVHYLEKTERIVLEARTRGSIATICNWEKYQLTEDEARTDGERELNAERTPSERQVNLIEEGKKERTKEYINFETALTEYKALPGVTKGVKAEARFRDQITTEDLFACLITAIKNYRAFLALPDNSWRKPKTSFETFLGSKSSGFFWRDFINPIQAASAPKQYSLEDVKAARL